MNSTSRLAIMHYRPTCNSFQLSYNFSSTISVILKMMFLTTPTLVLYLNFVDQTQHHLAPREYINFIILIVRRSVTNCGWTLYKDKKICIIVIIYGCSCSNILIYHNI